MSNYLFSMAYNEIITIIVYLIYPMLTCLHLINFGLECNTI